MSSIIQQSSRSVKEEEEEEFDKDAFLQKHLQFNDDLQYTISELHGMIDAAIKEFKSEDMLLKVVVPTNINIVGDIHGQYRDLHQIFAVAGRPDGARYLFLGDYVDRGTKQLEVICCLLAWKISYPLQFKMLRGNHETRTVNRYYGFMEELVQKFGEEATSLWEAFNSLFDWMPIAALIENRILCMHGGVGPSLTSLNQIRKLKRPLNNVNACPLAQDLLWADPCMDIMGFAANSIRGVSWFFGENIVKKLCEDFKLDLIVRAHQMMNNGYGFFCDRKLVTIFSAPRYNEIKDNMAAIMTLDEKLEAGFKLFCPIKDTNNPEESFQAQYKAAINPFEWGYVTKELLDNDSSDNSFGSVTIGKC